MNVPKDAKRQEIKNRIAAAQARNQKRPGADLMESVSTKAVEAKDNFTAFARQHPVATVAGGVAIGVLVSALFKNSPTRKAGRIAGAKAAGLAAIGSEIAVAFAQQVMETASEAKQASADKLEDIGDAVGDTARRLKREANYRSGNAGDAARTTARDVGKTIARSFRRN
ncbi:hypothetical protein [Alteraurantiacibacter aquimixticola]|uniref:DUF883 family protein n=1 Tax=Alteraurantiacibacter aquimixticola TaxID=2489173 RepID=A0A4T3EZG1_9SPHN|nr:hypothetical protein [Alteraurantiacibacter aquimixticola]TIX50014.1 hypothetical protein E5222_06845 [Alteraurantiacibacter aquimixticola]